MRAAASADVSTAKCDTSFISRVKKEYLSQYIPHDLTRGGWDMSNGEGLFLQATLNFSVLTIAEGTPLSSPHSAIGSGLPVFTEHLNIAYRTVTDERENIKRKGEPVTLTWKIQKEFSSSQSREKAG